ncbi:MAG: hypothetical protein ACOC83_00445 [Gemmatimonadota bacterium]
MTISPPSDQDAVRGPAPPSSPGTGPTSGAVGRPRPTALLLVALIVGSLASLRAQEAAPNPGGGLAGLVVAGPDELPLAGAEVRIVAGSASAVTDSAGRFFLVTPPAPRIFLVVTHDGLRAGPVDVELPPEGPVRLRIAPDAVPLPTIDVAVERRPAADGRLAGFHRRLRRGHGHFVTREQIDRGNPSRLSHMFRQLPGLTVVRQEFGGTIVSDRPDCRLEFFVDGMRSSFLRIDALRPGDVAGIEVYHGTSRVPPRFVRHDYCGAVVVWTRVPGS